MSTESDEGRRADEVIAHEVAGVGGSDEAGMNESAQRKYAIVVAMARRPISAYPESVDGQSSWHRLAGYSESTPRSGRAQGARGGRPIVLRTGRARLDARESLGGHVIRSAAEGCDKHVPHWVGHPARQVCVQVGADPGQGQRFRHVFNPKVRNNAGQSFSINSLATVSAVVPLPPRWLAMRRRAKPTAASTTLISTAAAGGAFQMASERARRLGASCRDVQVIAERLREAKLLDFEGDPQPGTRIRLT